MEIQRERPLLVTIGEWDHTADTGNISDFTVKTNIMFTAKGNIQFYSVMAECFCMSCTEMKRR